MIDSGAQGNFISEDFVKKNKILTNKKPGMQQITMADGWVRTYASEYIQVMLKICDYQLNLKLIVIDIHHDVILGKPWLHRENPTIDWEHNSLTFKGKEDKLSHRWTAFVKEPAHLGKIPIPAPMVVNAIKMKKIMWQGVDECFLVHLQNLTQETTALSKGIQAGSPSEKLYKEFIKVFALYFYGINYHRSENRYFA